MQFPFPPLPDRVIKVSVPYVIAVIIALMSLSYAAGTYKDAFHAQQTKIATLEDHLGTLEHAVTELTSRIAVLTQRLDDIRDAGK